MEKNFSLNANGILIFNVVHGEDDLYTKTIMALNPKVRNIINPPPEDGKCMCCGRHISQVKPFGKGGDFRCNFDGALLVKNFRAEGPYDEEAEQAMEEALNQAPEDPYAWLESKYGREKGTKLYSTADAYSWTVKSWECRDCFILGEEEYFRVLYANHQNESKS